MQRTLGTPVMVPPGKSAISASSASRPPAQTRAHVGDDVAHLRVVLDRHQLVHLHAAQLGHAPQVVAREVHQHQVLGPLLVRQQQLGVQRAVVPRIGRARARAGDGPGGGQPVAHLQQALGRRGCDLESGRAQVAGERRRAMRAQLAVEARGPAPRTARGSAATGSPGRCRRPRCAPWMRSTRRRCSSRVRLDQAASPRRPGRATGASGDRQARPRTGPAIRGPAPADRPPTALFHEEPVHREHEQLRRGGPGCPRRAKSYAMAPAMPPSSGHAPGGTRAAGRASHRWGGPRRRRRLGRSPRRTPGVAPQDRARVAGQERQPRERARRGRALEQHARSVGPEQRLERGHGTSPRSSIHSVPGVPGAR